MSLLGPSFLTGLEGSGKVSLARGGPSQDLVWFRFGSNSAVLYDLSELTVKAVLSVPSHVNLTTGVVYSPALEKNVVVLNSTKIVVFDPTADRNDPSNEEGRGSWDVETLLETCCAASLQEDGNPVVDLVTTDDGNIFVLFSNGSIQSLQQCLQDSKSESRGEAAADHTNLYVKNFSERSHLVQRLQTHVFHHNGRLYSSHIYSVVHPRTKVGGRITVKTCRLAFNSETRVCKQTPFRTQELDKGVTSATRVGEKIVFVDGSGVVYTQDLFSEDSTSKSKLSLNLSSSDKIGIEKAEYVTRLSETKVAVIGTKSSGEGNAISVADVNFQGGFVLNSVSVKAVAAEGGAKLNCYGDNRILFKHGHRMATLFVEKMPSTMADFVGMSAFEESPSKAHAGSMKDWQQMDLLSQPLELYKSLPDALNRTNKFNNTIESLVKDFNDIPELLVLNTIEAIVRISEPDRGLLSRAFNVPVTESVLLQHLRNSEFSLVQKMLGHLIDMVRIESTETEAGGGGEELNGDKFEHHLTWIGCILNAHYANFLMSTAEGSIKMLEEALETVQVLEDNVNAMGETMAVVKLIHDKQMIQTDYSNMNYSIETVEL